MGCGGDAALKGAVRALIDTLLKGHFSLLLITLIGMFFLLPLVPAELKLIERLMNGFVILVLISCMRAAAGSRGLLFLVIALGLLNIVFKGIEAFNMNLPVPLTILVLTVSLIYYLLIFLIIMRRVLDSTPVTTDKICGAVSAYMLIGLIWAVIYTLFQAVHPQSFYIPESMVSDKIWGLWAIYFSFVSLTTIGYGDITPLTPAAQTYAFLEAVCGQIFLTVLIARLVALQIVHGNNKPTA